MSFTKALMVHSKQTSCHSFPEYFPLVPNRASPYNARAVYTLDQCLRKVMNDYIRIYCKNVPVRLTGTKCTVFKLEQYANVDTHTNTQTQTQTHTQTHSLTRDHTSAPQSFLLTGPVLSHSYSCGFNGGETS